MLFFKRFEPKLNFKANNTETTSKNERALFPTRNTTEKASVSANTGYSLGNRSIVGSFPVPTYAADASGVVVVEITVDKNGAVTQALYREKGSTTDNPELINAALTAAKKARFTSSDEEVQRGTITYNFKLQ